MTMPPRPLYWQQQLDAWLDSGLSGAAFCKQHELAYHQFTYWRDKLSKAKKEPSPADTPAGFTRVTGMPDAAKSELTLALPGGIAITGLHARNINLLGAILRQL